MRRVVELSALLLAVTAFSIAVGAERRGGAGFGPTLAQIVSSKAVQTEIAATEEQKAKISEAAAQLPPVERGKPQDLSAEQRRELMQKRLAAAKVFATKLAEILDEKQMTRVNEIRYQAMGIVGMVRDRVVVKALGITDEQREKIDNAVQEAMKQAEGAGREGFARAREAANAKVKELLSEDQRTQLEKMLGKRFDVSQLRPERGRGGRRPGN